jgi:hypothetical protein
MTITKDRWRDLCHEAAIERDPEKLAKLNEEINVILQHASRQTSPPPQASPEDEPLRSRGQSA